MEGPRMVSVGTSVDPDTDIEPHNEVNSGEQD